MFEAANSKYSIKSKIITLFVLNHSLLYFVLLSQILSHNQEVNNAKDEDKFRDL